MVAPNEKVTKKNVTSVVAAQAASVDEISRRLKSLENLIYRQESRNQNIIIGVLVALVLIVLTVAAEVILSNRITQDFYSNYDLRFMEKINTVESKTNDIDNKILELRSKNLYLK